jgi:hypothetical protein
MMPYKDYSSSSFGFIASSERSLKDAPNSSFSDFLVVTATAFWGLPFSFLMSRI